MPSVQVVARHALTRLGTTPSMVTRASATNWQNARRVGGVVVERDGGAIDQARIDEPRPHHPAQVGGPRDHVAFVDVVVVVAVHRALEWCGVRPGNRLGFTGGAGRERECWWSASGTPPPLRRSAMRQKRCPGAVGVAQRDLERAVARYHHARFAPLLPPASRT